MLPGIVPTWPLTNVSEKCEWSGSCDPVNFWALSANGPKWLKLRILWICVSVNTYRKWNRANRAVTWPMTSCNPKGQACNPDIGYLRLNISTTVQTAAMGQIPHSIERILVLKYHLIQLFCYLQFYHSTEISYSIVCSHAISPIACTSWWPHSGCCLCWQVAMQNKNEK